LNKKKQGNVYTIAGLVVFCVTIVGSTTGESGSDVTATGSIIAGTVLGLITGVMFVGFAN